MRRENFREFHRYAFYGGVEVGRCRLTVSEPVLKAPMVSALETLISINCIQRLLSISTCAATSRGLWVRQRRRRSSGSCRRWRAHGAWSSSRGVPRRGLTLVHFSAQPEPFWSHFPVSPCLIDWGNMMYPTYPTKCASVEPKSRRVCTPLDRGAPLHGSHAREVVGRGLLSFPFELNLSSSVHRTAQLHS